MIINNVSLVRYTGIMDALKLRTWDEKAKIKNMTLLPINSFKKDILSVIKKESIND